MSEFARSLQMKRSRETNVRIRAIVANETIAAEYFSSPSDRRRAVSARQEVEQELVHLVGSLPLHPVAGGVPPPATPRVPAVLRRRRHLLLQEREVAGAPDPHRG